MLEQSHRQQSFPVPQHPWEPLRTTMWRMCSRVWIHAVPDVHGHISVRKRGNGSQRSQGNSQIKWAQQSCTNYSNTTQTITSPHCANPKKVGATQHIINQFNIALHRLSHNSKRSITLSADYHFISEETWHQLRSCMIPTQVYSIPHNH